MANPGKLHLQALKRVLRYIKYSSDIELTYTGDNSSSYNNNNNNSNSKVSNMLLNMSIYTDANWANDEDDRRSTSGIVVKLGNDSITWCSKRQDSVALSTAESEYYSISLGMQEYLHINHLMSELKINIKTTLYCDNKSAISISANDMYYSRTKHISIRHHFVRDIIKQKLIQLKWIESENNLSDIFTKALAVKAFHFLRNQIMNTITTTETNY